jgi:phosphotransferase system enzyme I (PtsI)
MIETPTAALCVADVAQHADFLSVGTNDLTQYTMVAGRENPLVNDYFIDDHAAVMRLLKIIVAEANGCPVSICGELAGRPNALPALLDLGITTLSVAPPLIPELKERIRQL